MYIIGNTIGYALWAYIMHLAGHTISPYIGLKQELLYNMSRSEIILWWAIIGTTYYHFFLEGYTS